MREVDCKIEILDGYDKETDKEEIRLLFQRIICGQKIESQYVISRDSLGLSENDFIRTKFILKEVLNELSMGMYKFIQNKLGGSYERI
jgi:hypothetical protein